MLRGVVSIHLLFVLAFSIFMLEYFEQLYPQSIVCDKLAGCLYQINSSIALPCVKLREVGFNECIGQDFCCKLCQDAKDNNTTTTVIALTGLTITHITGAIYATLGILLTLYLVSTILIFKQKWLFMAGFFICFEFILLIIMCLFLSINLVIDFPYYRTCNSEFSILLGWLMVISFIFFDITLSFSHFNKVQAQVDSSRGIWKKLGKPLNLVFDYLFRVSLIWWPVIIIYFIGIGCGRWKPVI